MGVYTAFHNKCERFKFASLRCKTLCNVYTLFDKPNKTQTSHTERRDESDRRTRTKKPRALARLNKRQTATRALIVNDPIRERVLTADRSRCFTVPEMHTVSVAHGQCHASHTSIRTRIRTHTHTQGRKALSAYTLRRLWTTHTHGNTLINVYRRDAYATGGTRRAHTRETCGPELRHDAKPAHALLATAAAGRAYHAPAILHDGTAAKRVHPYATGKGRASSRGAGLSCVPCGACVLCVCCVWSGGVRAHAHGRRSPTQRAM